jgi:hypothetical protein
MSDRVFLEAGSGAEVIQRGSLWAPQTELMPAVRPLNKGIASLQMQLCSADAVKFEHGLVTFIWMHRQSLEMN